LGVGCVANWHTALRAREDEKREVVEHSFVVRPCVAASVIVVGASAVDALDASAAAVAFVAIGAVVASAADALDALAAVAFAAVIAVVAAVAVSVAAAFVVAIAKSKLDNGYNDIDL
jgi:hypothetical protein